MLIFIAQPSKEHEMPRFRRTAKMKIRCNNWRANTVIVIVIVIVVLGVCIPEALFSKDNTGWYFHASYSYQNETFYTVSNSSSNNCSRNATSGWYAPPHWERLRSLWLARFNSGLTASAPLICCFWLPFNDEQPFLVFTHHLDLPLLERVVQEPNNKDTFYPLDEFRLLTASPSFCKVTHYSEVHLLPFPYR